MTKTIPIHPRIKTAEQIIIEQRAFARFKPSNAKLRKTVKPCKDGQASE